MIDIQRTNNHGRARTHPHTYTYMHGVVGEYKSIFIPAGKEVLGGEWSLVK